MEDVDSNDRIRNDSARVPGRGAPTLRDMRRAGTPEVGSPADEISVIGVVNMLLRRRRTFVVVPVLFALIAGAGTLLQRRTYTAESRFAPRAADVRTSGLPGLAQLGISIDGAAQSKPIVFYVRLLLSRELLREAAVAEYRVVAAPESTDSLSGSLIDLYDIETGDPNLDIRAAVRRLQGDTRVEADPPAGLVRVRTSAPLPGLAVAINERLLDLVNDFNVRRRQSQARAERRFLEGRLESAERELQRAEEELEHFREEGPLSHGSAAFEAQELRLQRAANLRQDVYDGLAQARERARIGEVRNTPVITVIDSPAGSVHPTPRRLLLKVVLALIMGAFAAAGLVFGAEYFRQMRRLNPAQFAEFEELRQAAVSALVPRRIRKAMHTRENGAPEAPASSEAPTKESVRNG